MKLFRLISAFLATAAITNAQILVAIAEIIFEIEFAEIEGGATMVATVEAEIAISGAQVEGEVAEFAFSSVTTSADGRVAFGAANVPGVGTFDAQTALDVVEMDDIPIGEESAYFGGILRWNQQISVFDQLVTVQLDAPLIADDVTVNFDLSVQLPNSGRIAPGFMPPATVVLTQGGEGLTAELVPSGSVFIFRPSPGNPGN